MKRPLTLHPFILAVFPILSLFSHNIRETPFTMALIPMAVSLSVTALLLLLLRLPLKSSQKAAVIVSLFLILFFSYGHVYESIFRLKLAGVMIGRHRVLWSVWALILGTCSYFTIRRRGDLDNLTRVLNVVAVSILAVLVINISAFQFSTGMREKDKVEPAIGKTMVSASVKDQEGLPDIYYIIFDEYAHRDTVERFFDYDDHNRLTDYLSDKNFFVADKSWTNYSATLMSLSSSLNMMYPADEHGVISKDHSDDYTYIARLIEDNKVIAFLKSQGYKYVHVSSGWQMTATNGNADISIQAGWSNELIMMLVQTSMLNVFGERLLGGDYRERILHAFSELENVNKIEGPKFIFAHVLSPHTPFIFDDDGKPIQGAEMKLAPGRTYYESEDTKKQYRDQWIYISKRIEKLVDKILKESTTPPIIIIQSDHGTGRVANQVQLEGRFKILNAYYLPSGDYSAFYDSITPVNSFRLVFSEYFGADYELLEDKHFIFKHTPVFQFTDVTEKANP